MSAWAGDAVDRVTRAVADAESRTSAEFVVVVAPRSGTYTDVAWRVAAGVAAAQWLLAVLAPFDVHPVALGLELAISWPISLWLGGSAFCARWLTTTKRRARQVEDAALRAFMTEVVHGTAGRNGVLIYVSVAEGRATWVADLGIYGRVAPGTLADVSPRLAQGSADAVVAAISDLGERLAVAFPRLAGDANELSDAPRVHT